MTDPNPNIGLQRQCLPDMAQLGQALHESDQTDEVARVPGAADLVSAPSTTCLRWVVRNNRPTE